MSQHHFIIQFDSVTGEWSHDFDSEVARFSDGQIWVESVEAWVKANTNSNLPVVETVSKVDEVASEVISNVINVLNIMYKSSIRSN